jgi:glycerophosphoryl diester phosphodiesterase
MNTGETARKVLASFRKAWEFRWPFLVTHLMVRLLILAVISPIASLILSLAIATRGKGALTDQDIALFLLTPAGLIAAFAIICLLITGAVLDVTLMTYLLRTGKAGAVTVISNGLRFIISRFVQLAGFSLQLIVRILLIAIPFFAVAAMLAAFSLTQYDINYYLTHRPPVFLLTAAVIAIILLAMIVVLVRRLAGWSVALHLLLFEHHLPSKTFAESARVLSGHKVHLATTLAIWIVARVILGLVVAAAAGILFNAVPGWFGTNLRSVAIITIVLLILWGMANVVVATLSNGALSDILHEVYLRVSPDAATVLAGDEGTAYRRTSSAAIPTAFFIAMALAAIVFGVFVGGRLLDSVAQTRTAEIIAHRGAAASRPENTMAAINKAVEDEADWVEIDVQETADGEVVVAHDSDFMKLGGVDLKVWAATMADLDQIDIGSWFDPSYSSERTPTLREALQAVKNRSKVIIELKYYGHDVDLEARVAQIVEELEMVNDVAVMSLKIDGVRKMQTLRPDWRYGILAATAIGDLSKLEADFLAVNTGQASLQLIRRAHKQDRQVYVWTVDDPLTMSRMISMGVDGLITNKPALARQVMEARNDMTTYERLALWLTDRFRIGSFKLVADETDA